MAVPSSPKLSDVCAEFLAPATTPLSAFVRGGAYVPNVAQNASVPTSVPINLSQLAGAVRYIPVDISGPSSALGETFGLPTSQTTFSDVVHYSVTGGNSPSVSWSFVSGDNSMAQTNPGGTLHSQWNSPVNRLNTKVAVYRITASDGITSDSIDVTVTLIHSA